MTNWKRVILDPPEAYVQFVTTNIPRGFTGEDMVVWMFDNAGQEEFFQTRGTSKARQKALKFTRYLFEAPQGTPLDLLNITALFRVPLWIVPSLMRLPGTWYWSGQERPTNIASIPLDDLELPDVETLAEVRDEQNKKSRNEKTYIKAHFKDVVLRHWEEYIGLVENMPFEARMYALPAGALVRVIGTISLGDIYRQWVQYNKYEPLFTDIVEALASFAKELAPTITEKIDKVYRPSLRGTDLEVFKVMYPYIVKPPKEQRAQYYLARDLAKYYDGDFHMAYRFIRALDAMGTIEYQEAEDKWYELFQQGDFDDILEIPQKSIDNEE